MKVDSPKMILRDEKNSVLAVRSLYFFMRYRWNATQESPHISLINVNWL